MKVKESKQTEKADGKRKLRFNFFKTLLLSTLLPCFLATILLGLVFLPMMRRTAAGNDEAGAKLLLDTLTGQFERLYENAGEMTATVEDSSWIHALYLDMLAGKMPETPTRVKVTNDLNKVCVRMGAKSLSFKFYDSSVLYNNRGAVDDQERYREIYRDNIQYLFFENSTERERFSTVTFGGAEYLLYQCPFRDIPGGRFKGEINILFSSDVIGERLLRTGGESIASFRLTDAEGNRLWECKSASNADEKCVTLSRNLQSSGFRCCVDVPTSVYDKTKNTVLKTMIATLIVTLVVSALLSYIFSRAAYKPVQKIVWKFVGKDTVINNDIDALEQVFDLVLLEKSKLETDLDQIRPIARQKILGALLDGTAFLNDSFDGQMEQCRIVCSYPKFNVISLEVPFSRLEQQDAELTAELAMETVLRQLSSQLLLRYYLYYKDPDHYQIIVNYQSQDDLKKYISMLTAQCRRFFQAHTRGAGVYLGVGQAVASFEEIYRAAEQADTAINIASLNRIEQPLYFSEVAPELNRDYYYPLSEEMLLSRAITNCNVQAAGNILHNVIDENRLRPILDPECTRRLCADLCSTVTRSGQSLGVSVSAPDPKKGNYTLDEIETFVGKKVEEICGQILSRRQKTIDNEESKIIEYIDDHLYDSDLSLNGVAAIFDKSPTYVSLLFQEQRDIRFNTFVNKARIMRAIQLMDEQKLDSNAVYPMVGYVSLSTFRRNFAKYAGSNPGNNHRQD